MASNIAAAEELSPRPQPDRVPDFERHCRKCVICHHPDRATIEHLFLHWHNPKEIAIGFRLGDLSTIYRHAHAAGLYRRRQRNLRFVLEHVLERAGEASVSSIGVVRAVRAYACLSDAGDWIEPPTRVIVSHEAQLHALQRTVNASLPAPCEPAAVALGPISNRQRAELETSLNPSKQRNGDVSNRQ